VHIYVPSVKALWWNFLEISQLSIRRGTHKPPIFALFAILTAIS